MVAPGIELGTSGSVARNSDHYTTEAVTELPKAMVNVINLVTITFTGNYS
jgi:hypothetical protein